MLKTSGLVAACAMSACAVFGPSKEDHPKDVEANAAACEGAEQVPTLEPASFFAGPYEASTTRPDAGSVIALEGVPRANMICSQRGCQSECCDNGCGADVECAYVLAVDAFNQVCLDHPSFDCGGTDCSGYCTPFSKSPTQRYRFVGRVEYRESLGKTPMLRIERFCTTQVSR